MKTSKILVHLSVLTLVIAFVAMAQSDRGTITGAVQDPANAVVPGAAVVAKNTDTGAAFETVTTPTGNFTLASLPAGSYDLTVEVAGFKKVTRPGVRVQVAQTVRLDFMLQVGATTESITVSAEVSLLKTENGEQSINVSGDRINALPLNFGGGGGAGGGIRNWLSFIVLAPGVSGTNYNSPINGMPAGNFKVYLEGQDTTSVNDTNWTSSVAGASVEVIEEFSLQTSNFSAEFGQVMGGFFNFTTKSGTNQFHGSVYEYLTNEALGARRPFSHTLDIDRKHDYGFSVRGPVYIPKLYNGRNRTFFSFSLERFRNKQRSSAALGTLPIAAYRTGNFSAALTGRILTDPNTGLQFPENGIYDPNTTRTESGRVIRDLFPGNIIPQNRLDPIALKVQSMIPAADLSDPTLNWHPDIQTATRQSIPSIKIDHTITDRMKLSGYWSVQRTTQIAAADGLPIPITSRRDKNVYGHIPRLNFDYTIRPTLLFHLGVGYYRFHNPDSSPQSVLQYDAVKELGLVGSSTNPAGMPYLQNLTVNNRGGMTQALGPGTASLQYTDKASAVASATYIRNNHTYKLGGEFKKDVYADLNYYGAQGQYTFGNSPTAVPYLQTSNVGGGAIGAGYASFLLGAVNLTNINAIKDPRVVKNSWSLYIQDTWKVTRKLTLDYGLRWDLSGQGREMHYRSSEIGINTPNPSAGGLPGGWVYEGYGPKRCNCNFVEVYPYAIGPRLGVAYQLNPKTVIRAGWGVSYSAGANWAYYTGGAPAVGLGFNSITKQGQFGEIVSRFQDGIKFSSADLYAATLDPGIRPSPSQLDVPPAWGPQLRDPNGGRPARIQQWNIAIQRQLTNDMSLEVAYVGNRGIWEEARGLINLNAIRPSTFQARGLDLRNAADRTLLTSRIDSPLAAQRGFRAPYAGYPGSATVAQTLRPFPMFNDNLSVWWSPLGNNWYDSLQAKFTKRYSRGLDLTAAFTYQKELTLGASGTNDVFNRGNQKGLTGSSQPFVFVTGYNYETPRLTSNRIIRQLVGGWTFGGVLRYASGSLLSAPNSRNNLSQYTLQQNTTRFNRVPGVELFTKDPGCHCIDPTKDLILNPNAWVDAGPGEWGSASLYYNQDRWRRNVTEQMSVGRTFHMRERMFLSVRAEFFNVFNRLMLPMPSAGNPVQTPTYNAAGLPTGGYGFINATTIAGQRNGQLVARFQW